MGINDLQHITQNSQNAEKPRLGKIKSFFHKPWYIVYPVCLVVSIVVIVVIIFLNYETVQPLTLEPNAPTFYVYNYSKKEGLEKAKWSSACIIAKGKVVSEATMGGPVYHCVKGNYADGGKICKVNSDCISNRCVKYFSGDEIGPGPQHCATYENWDGPEWPNYR